MNVYLNAFFGLLLLIGTKCSEIEFNYQEFGPDFWKAEIPNCNGASQSPINIIANSANYQQQLANIDFSNYNTQINWNLTHNGHTVAAFKSDSNPVPSISMNVQMLGFYKKIQFSLSQFHFHWGYNDYQGSEHYLNNIKFPLELHLVHKSSTGLVAVLGFLFQLSEQNNTALNKVLTAVGSDNEVNSVASATFALSSLLPNLNSLNNNGYFRYSGSLTTPPCTQNVVWTVFSTLNTVSSEQLQVFRINQLKANFRDPQPLNNRYVYTNIVKSSANDQQKKKKKDSNESD